MWLNPQVPEDLVTFTEEILNGKFHFLCNECIDMMIFVGFLANIFLLWSIEPLNIIKVSRSISKSGVSWFYSVQDGSLQMWDIFQGYGWKFSRVPRSSRPEVFCNFRNLFKKRLWHRCFPVNFVKLLRAPLVATSGCLEMLLNQEAPLVDPF